MRQKMKKPDTTAHRTIRFPKGLHTRFCKALLFCACLVTLHHGSFGFPDADLSSMTLIGQIKNWENFQQFIQKLPKSALTGQVTGTSEYHKQNGNEDAILNISKNGQCILGIADGHFGKRAAQLIVNEKFGIAQEFKGDQQLDPNQIKSAFLTLQSRVKNEKSGSTLSIVINRENDNDIWIANIADSPVVVVDQNGNIYRSTDQDYKNPQEIQRMKRLGVQFVKNRFWTETAGLQVSKDFGITGNIKGFEPEPIVYKLNKNGIAFTLLSSDGMNDAYYRIKKLKDNWKYTGHVVIDNESSEPEDGWIDDLIQEALRISPDPDKPFNSKDLKALAKHYGQFHGDDISIILQGMTSKTGGQTGGEPVIQNTTFETLTRWALPVTLTVGAAIAGLMTYRYIAKNRKVLKKHQTDHTRNDAT